VDHALRSFQRQLSAALNEAMDDRGVHDDSLRSASHRMPPSAQERT
jgi:hypothetical protein